MDKIACSSCVLFSARPLLRVRCSLQPQPETAAGQSSQASYTFSYNVTAPCLCSETTANISTDFIREHIFPSVGSAGGDGGAKISVEETTVTVQGTAPSSRCNSCSYMFGYDFGVTPPARGNLLRGRSPRMVLFVMGHGEHSVHSLAS